MSPDQKAERVEQIRKNMELHDTAFLLHVWKTNNRREWTAEAFEAIHEILLARLGSAPAQTERDPREALVPREGKQRFFLTGFEGSVEFEYLNAKDAQHVVGRLGSALTAQRASNVHVSEFKVTFQVSAFRFVSNWNVLALVDKGEMIAHPGAPGVVKYTFSFVKFFVTTTLAIGLFSIGVLFNLNTPALFVIPAFVWLFAFGLNYIIAVFRLKDFVWQAISGEPVP